MISINILGMNEKVFWSLMMVLLAGALAFYSSVSRASEKHERPYTIGCP